MQKMTKPPTGTVLGRKTKTTTKHKTSKSIPCDPVVGRKQSAKYSASLGLSFTEEGCAGSSCFSPVAHTAPHCCLTDQWAQTPQNNSSERNPWPCACSAGLIAKFHSWVPALSCSTTALETSLLDNSITVTLLICCNSSYTAYTPSGHKHSPDPVTNASNQVALEVTEHYKHCFVLMLHTSTAQTSPRELP